MSQGQPSTSDAKDGEKTFTSYDICPVGVRLPPFWPEEPAVWFAQIEGSFALSKIKDEETKHYYVSAQLEHRYAAEVKDILVNPPAVGKYDTLKTELIKRLSASREKESSLQALADLADKVHDLVPPVPQVASADAVPGILLEKLTREVAELSRQDKSLSMTNAGRSRSRDSQRNRSRTRSQSSYRNFPTCIFHHRYGDKARRCLKPCDYKSGSGNAKGSHQ
ncbi:unnamed protein product [Pieris macdunnoughi]|uniref:DUF7041 domain-containing protein n=1 Tax=Pieris macdunnoughi TaxID=345717 RepID=A0A821XQS3_9NEOP|nr:unnamed protein product [Pieris macdunnoughi]